MSMNAPPVEQTTLADRFRKVNQSLEDLLIEIFRLKTYGDSLWSKGVSNWAFWMAVLLAIQFCVECWAWQRAWYYGVSSYIVSAGMAFAFATAIVVYDRSLAISDQDKRTGTTIRAFGYRYQITGTTRAFIFRGISLIALSLVNAIPVELAVFESEIDHQISETEVRRLDAIRDRAITTENQRFDRLVEETRRTVSANHRQEEASVADRRRQLLATQQTRRENLTTILNTANNNATREAGGVGPSGRQGAGTVYQALLERAREAQANLNAFETQANQELAAFDRTAGSELATSETSRGERIIRLETERRDKLHELELIQPSELIRRYGGSYEEPRGFLNRYAILQEMAAQNPRVFLIVSGLRVVMVIFGVFIMAHKLMAPAEVTMYYSLAFQAAAGNEDAQNFLRIRGIRNFAVQGYAKEVKDPLDRLYAACLQLTQELIRQQSERMYLAHSITKDLPRTGLPLAHIQRELLLRWEKNVIPKLKNVQMLRYECEAQGLEVPPWPANLNNGEDPTEQSYEPWKLERSELNNMGWIDPEPVQSTIRELSSRLIARRKDLSILEGDLMGKTVTQLKDHASYTDILEYRRKFWHTDVVPLLMEIDNLESQLKEKGKVIAWPNHYPDPSKTIEDRILRPNLDVLREAHQSKPNGVRAPIN